MPVSNNAAHDSVRVFLLIENRLLGETLVRLFRKRPDFCLVGRCAAADAGAVEVKNLQYDVLVLDICGWRRCLASALMMESKLSPVRGSC